MTEASRKPLFAMRARCPRKAGVVAAWRTRQATWVPMKGNGEKGKALIGKGSAVDVNGKVLLIPFTKPILVRVDRVARQIEIDPPEGLLDL